MGTAKPVPESVMSGQVVAYEQVYFYFLSSDVGNGKQ
jgi:hypothetical protein